MTFDCDSWRWYPRYFSHCFQWYISVDSLSRFTYTVSTFTTRNLWFVSFFDTIESSLCCKHNATTWSRTEQHKVGEYIAILPLYKKTNCTVTYYIIYLQLELIIWIGAHHKFCFCRKKFVYNFTLHTQIPMQWRRPVSNIGTFFGLLSFAKEEWRNSQNDHIGRPFAFVQNHSHLVDVVQ